MAVHMGMIRVIVRAYGQDVGKNQSIAGLVSGHMGKILVSVRAYGQDPGKCQGMWARSW